MEMARFYGRALKAALRGGFGIARATTFAVTLGLTVVPKEYYPDISALARKLGYPDMQLPLSTDKVLLSCAALALLWGFVRAIYLEYDQERTRAERLFEKLVSLEPKISLSTDEHAIVVKNTSGAYLRECQIQLEFTNPKVGRTAIDACPNFALRPQEQRLLDITKTDADGAVVFRDFPGITSWWVKFGLVANYYSGILELTARALCADCLPTTIKLTMYRSGSGGGDKWMLRETAHPT